MKTAAVILLIISHQGHWFGGQAGSVVVRPAAEVKLPAAVFVWELRYGATAIAAGREDFPGGRDGVITLKLAAPVVRAETELRLVYRLERAAGGDEIDGGEAVIRLYPADLLAGVAQRLSGTKIVIWDDADGLSAVLTAAGIKHNRIDGPDGLRFARPDIIVVAPDQLPSQTLAQLPLIAHAEQGASILVLQQRQPPSVAGYPLQARAAPQMLGWREDHPLARQSHRWDVRKAPATLRAIQLPADEPALVIAYWPREVEGKEPAPIDALLVTKSIGSGRLVLCQLPLGDWAADPRSQLFLADALDYLAARPEPTPPPSRRPQPEPRPVAQPPTLRVPSGANP